MSRSFLFTSESVAEGHPDKVCDAISDAVLDAIIANDPRCRVACETLVKTGLVVVAGEITTAQMPDIQAVARSTIRRIGYTKAEYKFDADSCGVLVALEKQSPDIARGVTQVDPEKQGAGDQGMMFGYACRETPQLMPLPITMAHQLLLRARDLRNKKRIPYLRPDAKSQVTVRYEDNKPVAITTVVVSQQHDPGVAQKKIRQDMIDQVIRPVLGKKWFHDKIKIHVNPTGRFEIGGPHGDSGLTGRKIIVDTYGGMGRHGGGAFSGKDPSKVDRSASYAARWVAKNIVAARLADRCEVQVAYAIGVAKPVSVLVQTFDTGKVDDETLGKAVKKVFDLRPGMIIQQLDLLKPIYERTAGYGHFGRKGDGFTWEKTDMVDALRDAVGR
jgi:S-adenosylmethionine synthetase